MCLCTFCSVRGMFFLCGITCDCLDGGDQHLFFEHLQNWAVSFHITAFLISPTRLRVEGEQTREQTFQQQPWGCLFGDSHLVLYPIFSLSLFLVLLLALHVQYAWYYCLSKYGGPPVPRTVPNMGIKGAFCSIVRTGRQHYLTID